MNERRCAENAQLSRGYAFGVLAIILAALSMLPLAGCSDGGTTYLATPDGAIVGRGGYWNYSPSAIQTGDMQQIWWCGAGLNPTDPTQASDTILYESVNTVTHEKSKPVIVLAETK